MKKRRMIWLALIVVLIGAVAAKIIMTRNENTAKYNQAMADMEAENYAEAMAALAELENFGDAAQQYSRAFKARVGQLEAAEDWDSLLNLLGKRDSDYYRIVERKVATMAEAGQGEEALAFVEEALPDNINSISVQSHQRHQALAARGYALMAAGRWYDASHEFSLAYSGNYDQERMKALMAECRGRYAMELMKAGNWKDADDYFQWASESGYEPEQMQALADKCNFFGFMSQPVEEMVNEFSVMFTRSQKKAIQRLVDYVEMGYAEMVTAGDDAGIEKLMNFIDGSGAAKRYRPMMATWLKPVSALYDSGQYADAAALLYKKRKLYDDFRDLYEPLKNSIFDALLEEGQWQTLAKYYQDELLTRAAQDPALEQIAYLLTTGRVELAGTDPGFDAICAAGNYGRSQMISDEIFKDLYYASGDPAEQYAAARAYARNLNREGELLSRGMDITTALAAGEESPCPVRAEVAALLPVPSQSPDGDEPWLMDDFTAVYGDPNIFRAAEPRADRYTVIVTNNTRLKPINMIGTTGTEFVTADTLRLLKPRWDAIMEKLGTENKADSWRHLFRLAHNPNTAAYLVWIKADYEYVGTYYQSSDGVHYGNPVSGYANTYEIKILDTRNGEIIAYSEARKAPPKNMKSTYITPSVYEVCAVKDVVEGFGDLTLFSEAIDCISDEISSKYRGDVV